MLQHENDSNLDEQMILADDFWQTEPRKSPPGRRSLESMADALLSRRSALRTMAIAASGVLLGCEEQPTEAASADNSPSTLGFQEVFHGYTPDHHAPEGYAAQVLIRWGDKVTFDAPAFDIDNQSAAAQSKQFGYNNDLVVFLPLPLGSTNSDHGLLCVSHEFTEARLMNEKSLHRGQVDQTTQQEAEVEMAAHGLSVIEIKKSGSEWAAIENSQYNRRLTALDTEFELRGPAAGSHRLRTSADPEARQVIGTINNCAGGLTPWGTVLSGEENFQGYFSGDGSKYEPEARNHKRYSVGRSSWYNWHQYHLRFDLEQEPNEPNRFGWIVELDPHDPESTPIKRTALGRFRHEGGTTALAADGRIVVYMGDDDRGEYLYKFVTRGKYDPDNREANRHLLDEGTLYVAKFESEGVVNWLPLEFGKGPLTPKNDFRSQADVLIETRRAADLLEATPMDRPEDVETNPLTGRVYVMLTNNTDREPGEEHVANPRAWNKHGHIIELIAPSVAGRVDHGAHQFFWDIFLMAGDPEEKIVGAKYHPDVSPHGWLSCPDNCVFDAQGRIWIATDGMPKTCHTSDGVFVADTVGPGRALTRCFFQAPRGAEVCGPAFTPDGSTLFVAVQHPGDERGSTFGRPTTRWPDFDPKLPPRPSVVAITKTAGGSVGS